ncbi:hypothetical protein RBD90_004481 [Salmonella enterica]|nr:hypothetical protein [Salmonella enterica]ELG7717154.1 hypothetical protein [Salmonella enterica]ELH0823307.1 hypothetical protein [Salmonella enterica]
MEDLEYKYTQTLARFNIEFNGLKDVICDYKQKIPFLNADIIVGMILMGRLNDGLHVNAELCEFLSKIAHDALKEY